MPDACQICHRLIHRSHTQIKSTRTQRQNAPEDSLRQLIENQSQFAKIAANPAYDNPVCSINPGFAKKN
jgi:hypothetical protein